MKSTLRHGWSLALIGLLVACGGGGSEPGAAKSKGDGSLQILPQEAYANHVLKAGDFQFAASMGGNLGAPAEESRVRWLINGQVAHEGFELEPGLFHRGDIVEVQRVSGPRGEGARILERDQIVIRNSPPRINSVVLARSRDNGAYLQCEVGSSDADFDAIQLEYEWSIDGKRFAGARGELVSLHDVAKGSKIGVKVVASDGQLKSQPFDARPYLFDNRAPKLQVSEQANVRSAEDGSRTLSFAVRAEDPDGDAVDIRFEGAPADASYDQEQGLLSWQVEGQIPAMRIVVKADDGRGAVVEHELQIVGEELSSR